MTRLTLLLALAMGCHGTPPPASVGGADAHARPLLLYRVAGTHGPSYLMGTCHTGATLDEALPAAQRTLLDHASVVAVEADIAPTDDPVSILRRAVLPQGESLRGILGEDLWRIVTRDPRLTIWPWMALDRMQPVIVMSLFLVQPAAVDARAHGAASGSVSAPMDAVILRNARAAHTPVEFLETLDQQMAMLTSMPRSEVLAAIRSEATSPNATRAMVHGITSMCTTGDTRNFESMLHRAGGDPFLDVMLNRRSAAWEPRVETLIDRGGAFIAVGAGHVVGNGGLVALLRAHGRTVEQITVPADDRVQRTPVLEVPETPSQTPAVPSFPPATPSTPGIDPLAAYRETIGRMANSLSDTFCHPGHPLLECYAVTEPECTTTLHDGFRWCFEQHLEHLPARVTADNAQAIATEIVPCVLQSYHAVYALEGRTRATPSCATAAEPGHGAP